jgi:hypothetical protein
MTTTTKAFKITYTKKIGGQGTIIVKALDAENAIKNAKYLCFTGSDFCNPIEVPIEKYTKPRNQGFQGSERAN